MYSRSGPFVSRQLSYSMTLPILKTFCQQVPVLSGGLCICICPSLAYSDSLLDSPLTQKGLTTLGSQNCKEGFLQTTFILIHLSKSMHIHLCTILADMGVHLAVTFTRELSESYNCTCPQHWALWSLKLSWHWRYACCTVARGS